MILELPMATKEVEPEEDLEVEATPTIEVLEEVTQIIKASTGVTPTAKVLVEVISIIKVSIEVTRIIKIMVEVEIRELANLLVRYAKNRHIILHNV